MALPFASPGFLEYLVVLGSAGLVIPAFHRLRVNPVIGFILVGLFAGPYGLGALTDDLPWVAWISLSDAERIEPFAEIGIILLLFSIGLELSFRRLWDMRRSEEHTSEHQSLTRISYAVFCLKKNKINTTQL